MRSIKWKLAIFFSVATIAFGLTQEVYRRNIETLHNSLYKTIDTLDDIHITESVHSAMHAMLMSAKMFERTKEYKYIEQYEIARREGDSAISKILLSRNTKTNEDHPHDGFSPDAPENISSDVLKRFSTYKNTLDQIFSNTTKNNTDLISRGDDQFDNMFTSYYMNTHYSHYNSLQLIRDEAHLVYKQSQRVYIAQLALTVAVGVFLILFADRVFLKIFRAIEIDSMTDALTGLYNRRYLENVISCDAQGPARQGRAYSLAMIDVDHFKIFNDSYGHIAGDKLLANIATVLVHSVRKTDSIVRYGGEEFLAVLPTTTKQEAVRIAEKIREAIKKMELILPDSNDTPQITVSIGVSSFPDDADSFKKLVKVADERLYQAKMQGRNIVKSQ